MIGKLWRRHSLLTARDNGLGGHIVDKACVAEPGRNQHALGPARLWRLERLGVTYLEIVYSETRCLQLPSSLVDGDRSRALRDRLCHIRNRAVDHRCSTAFLGAEIAVATRHRDAVPLPHCRRGNDLQREIEVARRLADDAKLLVILLAKYRKIRANLLEQLRAHRRNAGEEIGPKVRLQSFCRP